jgi:hypothetical protein
MKLSLKGDEAMLPDELLDFWGDYYLYYQIWEKFKITFVQFLDVALSMDFKDVNTWIP